MKRIEVAVGVVYNQQGLVLVGQRIVKDLYFQKWEFPGGKLEAGETVEQALAREFLEETSIRILSSKPLMLVEHDYPDRHVRLHVHTIKHFDGNADSREGQALKWVSLQELNELDFLQGNQLILEKLQEASTVKSRIEKN
ncbi:MAG: 8-oxo-dGTP diphosphatase MutT [Arenicella sp.]|nr:8-oxo-dGTP diphosphatase MutT [Arenicella sp.]